MAIVPKPREAIQTRSSPTVFQSARGATPDAFGAGIARAQGEGGASLVQAGGQATAFAEQIVAANVRINERKEGIARDQDDTAYAGQLDGLFRDIQDNGNFADEKTITGAREQAETIKREILQNHTGGELSRAELGVQLGRRLTTFTDTLLGENISAGRAQLTASFDSRSDAIVADELTNPGMPIEARFAQVDEVIGLLGLRGNEADAARSLGREKLGTAIVSRAIERADIDDSGLMLEARALLENPILRDVLPSTARSGFANRIFEIENTIQRVGLEARAEVIALESVADQLGLEGDAKTDFIVGVMGGGSATVSDKRAALDRLVNGGVMDQETSDKIASGALRVAQVRNPDNGDLENVLVDLTQAGGALSSVGQPAAEDETQLAAEPVPEAVAEPVPEAVAEPVPEAVEPEVSAEEQSIFQIVAGDTAVTGLGPAIAEGLQGITGQFGFDVAPAELLLFRKRIDNNIIPLIDSLVPSTRFPVAQIKLIRELADIETGPGTDRRSLLTSIVALDETLFQMQRQAEDDARNPKLANDVKQAQAENAAKLRNFRTTLGVPDGFTAADIEALGEPEEGGINEFISSVRELIESDGGVVETEVPSVEAITTIPTVAAINKMTEDDARATLEGIMLAPDTPITDAQVKAIKKKLGID